MSCSGHRAEFDSVAVHISLAVCPLQGYSVVSLTNNLQIYGGIQAYNTKQRKKTNVRLFFTGVIHVKERVLLRTVMPKKYDKINGKV